MEKRLSYAGALALGVAGWLSPQSATAEEPPPVVVDAVIGRFTILEGGRDDRARPIFAREIAFEARLEALASGESPEAPLGERHLRAALARHITEVLLAELPLDPPPTPEAVGEQAVRASNLMVARVGGADRLKQAMAREQFGKDELDQLTRRTARASLYLNRMVAPLLEPNDRELMLLLSSGATPYPATTNFAEVADDLRRRVLGERVAKALEDFYQRARARVVISWFRR